MTNPRLNANWALAVARDDAKRARDRAKWAKTFDPALVAHYEKIAADNDALAAEVARKLGGSLPQP